MKSIRKTTKPRKSPPTVTEPQTDNASVVGSPFSSLVPLLVVIISLAVFWRVQDHGFVWDDGANVERNQYLKPVTLASLTHFWQKPHENLYVPVTYTAWAAIARFAWFPTQDEEKIKLNPRPFHLGNVILHSLSALVVFAILRLLISNEWAAGGGALLFALHPVQVEPVAWVTGLKDVLSGLLSLVAVWQYLVYASATTKSSRFPANVSPQRGDRPAKIRKSLHFALATLAYLLALLAKPAAVVTPVIAWLLDYCMHRRLVTRNAMALGVWIAIALPFVILTKWQQPDTLLDFVTPLWARPLVAADTLAFYLYKLFVPLWLGPGYGRSPELVFAEGWVYFTWIVPIGLGAALCYLRRRKTGYLVAAGVFVAGLLPVLGFIPFQFQNWSTVADRYLYLSMLGPALALAWFLSEHWNEGKWIRVICGAILLLLGLKSVSQAGIWHSSQTLWRYALDIGQDSGIVRNNLGGPLVDSKLDEAIFHLRQAVFLSPDLPDARVNLGIALARRGEIEEAIAHYRYALELRPAFPNVHHLLGNALASSGRLDEAIKHYRQALQSNPADAKAHNDLGNALADLGWLDEAIEHYGEALQLNPGNAGTHFNLGIALADRGESDEAIRHYREALKLNPNLATAHYNIAAISYGQGRIDESVEHLRQALRAQPDYPEAHYQLAKLLARQGKKEEAEKHSQEAQRLKQLSAILDPSGPKGAASKPER